MSDQALPIDPAVIAELQGIMGDDFNVLVETFEHDALTRVRDLREHVAAHDADAIRQVAHSFKGSAGNFGAVRLANLCQSLESMGKSSDLADAASCLQQVEAELARVSTALKAILSR